MGDPTGMPSLVPLAPDESEGSAGNPVEEAASDRGWQPGKKAMIGFDLDDVLVDFFPLFADVLQREHGVDVHGFERTHWHYVTIPAVEEAGLGSSDIRRIVHQACHDEQAHAVTVPIDESLIHTIRQLRQDGHRVALTTSRPPTAMKVIATMLDRWGLVLDDLRLGPGSKFTVDILVEDSVHQAAAAAERGITVFVPDRPWNRDERLARYPGIHRYAAPQDLGPMMRGFLSGTSDPFGFSTANQL